MIDWGGMPALIFLVALLALALVGFLVVACLAFSEVGAALGARGFLAAGASSSAATRRVGAERARFETRCCAIVGRWAGAECRGAMRRTVSLWPFSYTSRTPQV